VDVDALVSRYEVTSAPVRDGGRRLRLVWVRPPDVELALDVESEPADAPARGGAVAVLDAYRVTRVPAHPRQAAS
jgi:hypothetical protein